MSEGDNQPRNLWGAVWRGLQCRCPRCGRGWLFRRYLEQVEQCAECGEPFGRYEVGLFLPLVVMLLVVGAIATALLVMELTGTGYPMLYYFVLVPLSLLVPLAILPSCKGALIGLLWAKDLSDVLDR